MLRRTLAGLIAVAAALAAALAGAPAAGATPLDGNGSWIWYLSASGGSPSAVAREAERNGLDVVYVKSSDGVDRWSQFSPELVHALHRRGIKACAWPFIYGTDPGREAKLTAEAADAGADCIVIDAESDYEGRYRQAYVYIHKLRRLVGEDYPLALAGFPYTDYHPTFPYTVFLGAGGARYNAPQLYWHAIGDSVREAFAHTYRWNRAYDRPIFPIGQTYEDPGRRELLDFRRYAREYGAGGVSWWSWQETSRSEWGIVGRRGVKGVKGYEPDRSFAPLERGDAGDMVVLAQELLLAWGRKAVPTGAYDQRTVRAVLRFQADEGLQETGRIGDATWKQLIKREPLSTNWKQTAVPKRLVRSIARTGAEAEFLPPPKAGTEAERVADPGAGPVALKRVSVGQDKLSGSIRFTVRNPLPPLRALHLYPENVNSSGRHLCLIADGNAIKRRMICVGGKVKKGKIELGISRYHKGGGAKKVGRATAKLKRVSSTAVRLEFPLRSADFEPGRFRYWAASSWRGPECDNGTGGDVCHSHVPAGKRNKGKINKVERVGCTPGVKGFTTQGPTDRKRVALTFDDGPSAYTEQVLHILDDKHVNGTFFEIGTQTGGAYSGVMRTIVAHGNEIGNHSYRHETLPSRDSMAATSHLIQITTGFEPCHFRPPGGAYNSGTVSSAWSLGMGTVNWNIDTRDWDGPPSAGTIQSRAVGGGKGAIILMHDGGGDRSNTVAALPGIIDSYRKRGYKMVTLTELLGGHFKLREKR